MRSIVCQQARILMEIFQGEIPAEKDNKNAPAFDNHNSMLSINLTSLGISCNQSYIICPLVIGLFH